MREFRLCSKSHNAQYTSTKIKAIPVRTDNAMQEMLVNSFLEKTYRGTLAAEAW